MPSRIDDLTADFRDARDEFRELRRRHNGLITDVIAPLQREVATLHRRVAALEGGTAPEEAESCSGCDGSGRPDRIPEPAGQ